MASAAASAIVVVVVVAAAAAAVAAAAACVAVAVLPVSLVCEHHLTETDRRLTSRSTSGSQISV